MRRLQPIAISVCLVLATVGCAPEDTAGTSSTARSAESTAGTTTSIAATTSLAPTTTVVPASGSATAEDGAQADDDAVPAPVVYETSEDLCSALSGEEILEIVNEAYVDEGVDYPIPDVIQPVPDGFHEGVICEWTVPGTAPGWGRDDFTVAFADHSDVRFSTDDGETATGPTHVEDYHGAGEFFTDSSEVYEVADIVPSGIVFLGGWSPGFDVYVESVDRIVNFRHDLATGATWDPVEGNLGVELRILTLMLERMHWLPAM